MATRRRMLPSGRVSAHSSWSRSMESGLSMLDQRRPRRSSASARGGPARCTAATWASAAAGKSGRKPSSSRARRARSRSLKAMAGTIPDAAPWVLQLSGALPTRVYAANVRADRRSQGMARRRAGVQEEGEMSSAFSFRSAPPIVRLTNGFVEPFDNAVAAARTCYSPRIVKAEDVRKDDKARAVRDRIARETYQAGHHTTLQHATFQFSLENVSRQLIWSVLHAHPFYNSEQVSQRYVEVKPDRVIVPALPEREEALYRGVVEGQR